MAARQGGIEISLVGRHVELDVVSALLAQAATGEAGALLISGDPGIGKTALVQHACARVDPSTLTLAGACLPLASMTVPFLALRSALRGARSEGLQLPVVIKTGDSPTNFPVAFDAWLDDLCTDRPVILVIDDLHWADQSTLDVLMYVLAGPTDRRLAVIATIRSDEVGDGHPFQHWLADVRRLPRVGQMTLGPLDRITTGEQIAALLGASPHQSLVEDVFSQTRGNSYLNQLVVSGLPPDARHLPPDLPADLKSAVLQPWRRLSDPARELAGILAVGGGPRRVQDLTDVVGDALDGDTVLPLLREAVGTGTLDMARDGTYWFHHPMIAEVLERSQDDEERRRWHAAYAVHEEKKMTDASAPAVETLVAAADHHHWAGNLTEAYRWALRAAEAAGAAGGASEMLRLLRRAVNLRSQLTRARESEHDLLKQLMAAAGDAGAHEEELRAVDLLVDSIDPEIDPLLVAELLVRRAQLHGATGRAFVSMSGIREAVRLSAAEPDSWQHALSLAELARAEFWQDDPEAPANADRALIIARAAGNPRALSYALSAKAMVTVADRRSQEGLLLATEALDFAVQARDYWAYLRAAVWEANTLETWSTRVYVDHLGRRREQMTELGAPHVYIARTSAEEAGSWLAIGDWQECLNRLRVALGSDPGPYADVTARLTAARLAAWQGRTVEAQAHLARADEISAEGSGFLLLPFDATRAEVCFAAGDPAAAFDAAMAGATSPGVPPMMCEWLMPLAVRALADQIQADRDAGGDPASQLARLDDLMARFPAVIRESFEPSEQWDLQINALGDLYAAEVGRARHVPDNGAQWVHAADACHTAMLAWEEVYACWRGAEALLMRRHQQRELAASVLRRGLAFAQELEARPIQANLLALASSARIAVDLVKESPPTQTALLPGLTAREREILDHVVAGRTYSEIARDLVISEKTVSSHISNLLRKTGTSNRVELSQLATRTSGTNQPQR